MKTNLFDDKYCRKMSGSRIENKRFEKTIRFLKWTLIPITLFLQYRKTAKKWGGQFIEWSDHQILFKSRNHASTTIELADLEAIEVKLDFIILKTKETKYEINIEDYTEYKDRIHLKNHLEKLKEKLEDKRMRTVEL